MRLPVSVVVALLLSSSCGQKPGSFSFDPDAELAAPKVSASPEPGPFNGELTITLTAERPATIYVSTNGKDPRETSDGRQSGPSPLTLTINATTTLRYFASVGGKDSELFQGTWQRAGGPVGTISGVVVVGGFAVGKKVGVYRNLEAQELGTPAAQGEIPFLFTNVQTGTHRLTAISDRNDDGQLIPILDYSSATVNVDVDLTDPFKAGPENVRLYLGASGTGLGTLRGTISLPNPPAFQSLQIALLDPSALTGGLDPTTLLQQLQSGYQIITNAGQAEYPYVITDLAPGRVMPVPSLIGFGNGGVAINLLANPLAPVNIVADQETIADFAFGPATLSGNVTLGSASAPDAGFGYGIVAAKVVSISQGEQAVLMPILLVADPSTGGARSAYSGAAFRSNSLVQLRVFTTANGGNPLTDAFTWVVNPLSSTPAHGTVQTGTATDVTKDLDVP